MSTCINCILLRYSYQLALNRLALNKLLVHNRPSGWFVEALGQRGRIWQLDLAKVRSFREESSPFETSGFLNSAASEDTYVRFRLRFEVAPIGWIVIDPIVRSRRFDRVGGRVTPPVRPRSSFRDWAAEQTNTPREVVEAALAHTVRNPTEAAYARSDLFERRRRLMDDWAAYLSGPHGVRPTPAAIGSTSAH